MWCYFPIRSLSQTLEAIKVGEALLLCLRVRVMLEKCNGREDLLAKANQLH